MSRGQTASSSGASEAVSDAPVVVTPGAALRVTNGVTKRRRKAMTNAVRQAKYRKRKKAAALAAAKRAAEEAGARRAYQPPYGYNAAKGKLKAAGHTFLRVHEDFGREFGGVFVDGAYVGSHEVIELADLSAQERKARLDAARTAWKAIACDAVTAYMAAIRVSLGELIHHHEAERRQAKTWGLELTVPATTTGNRLERRGRA
jgi:hypothetical protein